MSGEGHPGRCEGSNVGVESARAGHGAAGAEGELGADGYWHVDDVQLASAGCWHMRIDALVTDFEKITLEDDLDIATR